MFMLTLRFGQQAYNKEKKLVDEIHISDIVVWLGKLPKKAKSLIKIMQALFVIFSHIHVFLFSTLADSAINLTNGFKTYHGNKKTN